MLTFPTPSAAAAAAAARRAATGQHQRKRYQSSVFYGGRQRRGQHDLAARGLRRHPPRRHHTIASAYVFDPVHRRGVCLLPSVRPLFTDISNCSCCVYWKHGRRIIYISVIERCPTSPTPSSLHPTVRLLEMLRKVFVCRPSLINQSTNHECICI